jgi:acyl-CoA reductase-like NAD-dependent aldehyde dehydrogenase
MNQTATGDLGRLQTVFDLQRAAHARAPVPAVAHRTAQLARLGAAIKSAAPAIARAISADFGNRSPQETVLLEVFTTLEAIRYNVRHVRRWAKPERRPVTIWNLPGSAQLHRQPLGVVGIVVPWNYPLYLAAGPLVSALAAGNRSMIKLSEAAPRFGELFARLVADTFAEDEVAALNGGVDVAEAFVRLPFDHLLFTGSTRVGREVMRAASEHLTPVTLELGGKSPVIVCEDFPIDLAARRILFGKCANAGQTCIAPDYALIPAAQVDPFVGAAVRAVRELYPTLRSPDYTSISSDRHYARLSGYLDDAAERGAAVHPLHEEPSDPATRKLAPTALTGVSLAMRVMQDEIFGPILPIIPYDRLEEAIGFVNARPRPLALYAFSNHRGAVDRILQGTLSGGVTVNDTMLHVAQDALPFGGVGPSGMGVYHGREGFDAFSKLRGVYYQRRFNGLSLLQPPYGARFKRLIGLMLR